MKIEWLNEEMTRARVTRREFPDFWHVTQAEVYEKSDPEREHRTLQAAWYYKGRTTDLMVEGCFEGFLGLHTGLARRLQDDRERIEKKRAELRALRKQKEIEEIRLKDNPWQPVAQLPKAKLLDK